METPLPLLRSALLAQFPNVRLAQSTLQGEETSAPFGFNLGYNLGDDDGRVTANIARFAERLDLNPEDLAFMNQVHGATIREVSEPGVYDDTDAMITTQAGIGLTVRTADCVPVMLYAPGEHLIAAVHAGWRGTAEHIVQKTAEMVLGKYNVEPASLYAYVGAAAASCCYEVGDEVAALFPEGWVIREDGKAPHLDLKGLNVHQLEEAGLPIENIDVDEHCSIHERTLLHSYRRDGERSGRMLTTIVLREEF
ncbi:MAG: peptidoglycan editing factor PgeF [Ignavibacteria bacterium]|nr:MAG: peptidoglycan editing factor PgeF [Ignavibacteria bacterium]